MTNIAQVLIAAKKIISDPRIWWQQGVPSGGTICASMAIGHVLSGRAPDEARYLVDAAQAVLARAIGLCNSCLIPGWNDNPERTHAEVMEAFDKAISLALGKDQPLKLPDSITQLLDLPDCVESDGGGVSHLETA